MKKIALIIIVVIFAGVGWYFSTQKEKPSIQKPIDNETAGLQEIKEPELGFSFQLPKTFTVTQNGQFSRTYHKKTTELGAGPTNFIYISMIPTGKTVEPGEIYNYSLKDFQILNGLASGQSTQVGGVTDPNLSGYYKYTRIDDTMIGGYGAKAFKNEKPWEFPNGTVEYRYIIPFAQANYLVGGYIDATATSTSSISKQELDTLLKGLKLSPDTMTLVFITPIQENKWLTFSDKAAGISFDYPSGWTKRGDGQNFQEGDLFTITAIGQTQRQQTELYDGASFAVMKPIAFTGNLTEWMKKRYDQQEINPERAPDYSEVSFGGKTYQKMIVCGLGCFTYYHIVQNDKLYGFVIIAVGPNKSTYESTISKIMSGLTYE